MRSTESLRTTKSLWIAEDGTRLQRQLVVVALSKHEMELVVAEKDAAATSIYLSSLDGFSYKGSASVAGETYNFALRVFQREQDFLIYGNWRRLQICGEVCIEAESDARHFVNSQPFEVNGDLPSAA